MAGGAGQAVLGAAHAVPAQVPSNEALVATLLRAATTLFRLRDDARDLMAPSHRGIGDYLRIMQREHRADELDVVREHLYQAMAAYDRGGGSGGMASGGSVGRGVSHPGLTADAP